MINENLLKGEERVIFSLREIYKKHGYSCFKMSKFEEYDLYGQNKEFLISDALITFTDTNGKLMALKPDVTLSIVKNSSFEKNKVNRYYYNENVYRISPKTHQFKEIMQSGLECMGDLTLFNICEVAVLASESLQAVSDESVLTLSHLGVVSSVIGDLSVNVKKELLKRLKEKNAHETEEVCRRYGISEEKTTFLKALSEAYGEPKTVIEKLKLIACDEKAISSLDEFLTILRISGLLNKENTKVDFSLIGDMNYYNGLIFGGYVKGIPTSILSGGQYDLLMNKMGKNSKAIGFAVYLDALERLEKADEYDADVLLLYSESETEKAMARVSELTSKGLTVNAQIAVPEKGRYKTTERI